MIYQDINGVFYVWQGGSSYLLRFTYESIKTHIEAHHPHTDYSHIHYYYTEGILYYVYGKLPERSRSSVWPEAIQSILDGTANVELVSEDFLEEWKKS